MNEDKEKFKKSLGNLKINVSLGSFKIELEGESEVVIAQFNEIKKNGLGQVVDQLVPLVNRKELPALPVSEVKGSPEIKIGPSEIDSDLPSLKSIFLRSLPSSEPEWVTVYGYYTIHQSHKETFTREDLIERYKEPNRWTFNNRKNLSGSIKSATNKLWINPINENEFVVTNAGNDLVKEIFTRTAPNVKIPKKRKNQGQVKIGTDNTLDSNGRP